MKTALRLALAAAVVLSIAPASAAKKKEDDKKKEEPKWDVQKPGGPRKDVKLDVDEGTWMSLDVSPDGKEIAFDLLGDLYVIPVAGGEAKPLASGIAWDMQPRYSPDGKKIAFTSDRAGGDNLWVMDRDGKNPKAISAETFRLVNSPAWSPDGEWIAGRKHFTSKRSLGAGEIWLWHRAGSDGVQATEKPTDQKDVGEPAFSPDGRYLYYSLDVSPGRTFEYSKDPNGQIYAIHRLDRTTGETDTFAGGPGGAIRPTPSPDGKTVAFVRRIRAKSVLMLADVESGEERVVWDGLERDMQETWAIHGVYPAFAWTPDAKSIVLWAGGKIRRIDVATKAVATIPFHVKDVRSVADALRFPVDVAPATFRPKMLRWVQVSPDGKQVAFQTLGKIWIKDVAPAGGAARRLTKQEDHFEQSPAWSRDGKSIVYTTWDDERAGSIRIAPAAGGEGRTVTAKPGHYREPALSPDGTKVVYRASSDGYLGTPLWSRDTGLYWIPAAGGGKPSRISTGGSQPVFGAASDRVFFTHASESNDDKTPDVFSLKSIDLDGSDERTHFTSDEAIAWRVAPDEKWVAWQENFKVFIATFARTGKAIDLSPDAKNIPVAKVTKDAGDWLHWSGDSTRLSWSLGSQLFSRDLKDSFAFLAGAPEKLPDPPEKGVDLSFDVPADVPAGTLAFTGARIVTMKGDEVIEDGTIVVTGNRITAVGARGKVSVPTDAKTVDVAGKTIIPGLVDVHWHGSMATDGIVPEQSWVNYASLAFGVTTIHDPSNDTQEIFAASEMARAGAVVGPRIFSTGTILYGAKGAGLRAPIDSVEDARSHLRRMKAAGAISVKSYNQPRRDQRQQVIQAGRELGVMVVPEGASLFHHNMSQVVDGHTGIEHAIPMDKLYRDVTQLWSGTQTGYTPTLVVAYGGWMGEKHWYETTNVWEDERLLSFVPRRFVDPASRRREKIPPEELNHIAIAKGAKALTDAGVRVNVGAHGQREGLGAHWEMWMFEQGGMTPLEAIRAGTLNGAKYVGLDKDVGSLEVGKLADLVVIDGNPLQNLRDSKKVRYTLANGRLFDAATMNEIGSRQRERRPFWFESAGGNDGWKRTASAPSLEKSAMAATKTGKPVTLEGKAFNAKAGAVIQTDDGEVVYVDGLENGWPKEVANTKRVRATGTLLEEKRIPDPGTNPITAGADGDQTVLYDAKWTVVN